jgi:hypothetical protein
VTVKGDKKHPRQVKRWVAQCTDARGKVQYIYIIPLLLSLPTTSCAE